MIAPVNKCATLSLQKLIQKVREQGFEIGLASQVLRQKLPEKKYCPACDRNAVVRYVPKPPKLWFCCDVCGHNYGEYMWFNTARRAVKHLKLLEKKRGRHNPEKLVT